MSDGKDRARFAAREYVARVEREVGEAYPPGQAEFVEVAYETGYLRGATDTHEDSLKMMEELVRTARETGRLEGENASRKRESELLDRLEISVKRESAWRGHAIELEMKLAAIAAKEGG